MTEPVLHFVQCPDALQGHRMAYWLWGAENAPHVVVCAHGLSRQGRDFDVLARAICELSGENTRVICPDVAGRGQSDWLADPVGYQIPAYASDMVALLGVLKPATLDWVGTSMGGLIGIVVCAHAASGALQALLPNGVSRLVLNDVGPAIEWQALQRIGQYLGKSGSFSSLQEAAAATWALSTSFGPHSEAQWLELTRHMVKPASDGSGQLRLHYDPAIAVPFASVTQEAAAQGEAMLWQMYDVIQARTLITRGADSDLLSSATALAMTLRGPKARLVEFSGVGHAPTFVVQDQVQVVLDHLFGVP